MLVGGGVVPLHASPSLFRPPSTHLSLSTRLSLSISLLPQPTSPSTRLLLHIHLLLLLLLVLVLRRASRVQLPSRCNAELLGRTLDVTVTTTGGWVRSLYRVIIGHQPGGGRRGVHYLSLSSSLGGMSCGDVTPPALRQRGILVVPVRES